MLYLTKPLRIAQVFLPLVFLVLVVGGAVEPASSLHCLDLRGHFEEKRPRDEAPLCPALPPLKVAP